MSTEIVTRNIFPPQHIATVKRLIDMAHGGMFLLDACETLDGKSVYVILGEVDGQVRPLVQFFDVDPCTWMKPPCLT